jgi:hypothetical protein
MANAMLKELVDREIVGGIDSTLAWRIRLLFSAALMYAEDGAQAHYGYGNYDDGTPAVTVSMPEAYFTFTASDARLVAEVGEHAILKIPPGDEQHVIANFTLGLRHAIVQAEAETSPTPTL